MAKGSMSPFLSRRKSTTEPASNGDKPLPSAPRPSSSSVFPSLRKLDTTTSPTASKRASSRPSSLPASSSTAVKPTPLLSLRLSGPSFLDVVVRDRDNKEPVYIIETVRESSSIYRLNAKTDEAIKVSTIQWPNSVTRSKSKSGRTVQMANERWRDAEDFLKLGPLGSIATRKFNIPHYPHTLKWKLIPGGHYYCSTAGAKGPFAVLDSAVLNAPARLSIFHNCLDEEEEDRGHESYRGIPVLLLDYLVATSLLLVTDVQEWLDRPWTENGTVRIPGSSHPSVKRFLAIIHNVPLPPSPSATSPSETATPWESSPSRRASTATGYLPDTSPATTPPTPSTPGTSVYSGNALSGNEDIPPVPPLPMLPTSSRSEHHSTPFQHPFASSSTPHLPSTETHLSQTDGPNPVRPTSTRPSRQLPRPPILNLAQSQRAESSRSGQTSSSAWQSAEALRSTELLVSHPDHPTRSPSPSAQSTSSGSVGSRGSYQHAPRHSLGRIIRPPLPPPSDSLPLPPKLAQEASSGSAGSSSTGLRRISGTYITSPLAQPVGGLQAVNPDPLSAEDEERVREVTSQMMALHATPPQTIMRAPLPAIPPPTTNFTGLHMDAGGVRMRDAAARRSYAESVYEMPPPAYDAIDFSLPRLPLARPSHLQQ